MFGQETSKYASTAMYTHISFENILIAVYIKHKLDNKKKNSIHAVSERTRTLLKINNTTFTPQVCEILNNLYCDIFLSLTPLYFSYCKLNLFFFSPDSTNNMSSL